MKGSRRRLLGRERRKMENGEAEMERLNGSILDPGSFPSLQKDPSPCSWLGGGELSLN